MVPARVHPARPWIVLAVVFVVGSLVLQLVARKRRGPTLVAAGGLVLERALSVDGPGNFQPSALALSGGRLYTVSDKTSSTLFELALGPTDQAVARPALAVELPEARGEDLDFEGLAVEPDGSFLVLSEARSRVLRVSAAGAAWLPLDLMGPARRAGLLATRGAGLEGLALFAGGLVVAAERQPRGLVVAPPGASPRAVVLEHTRLPNLRGRPPDFSDLATSAGRLYALARNAEAVVELVPEGGGFEERRWWSFAEAVAANRYGDERFGMAEGLALDDARVYVILDNNGLARAGAPADRRPILFIFRRPAEM
jgi:uncharacterized protein YjiK